MSRQIKETVKQKQVWRRKGVDISNFIIIADKKRKTITIGKVITKKEIIIINNNTKIRNDNNNNLICGNGITIYISLISQENHAIISRSKLSYLTPPSVPIFLIPLSGHFWNNRHWRSLQHSTTVSLDLACLALEIRKQLQSRRCSELFHLTRRWRAQWGRNSCRVEESAMAIVLGTPCLTESNPNSIGK